MKQISLITAAFLLFAACAKEEPTPEPTPQTQVTTTVSLTGTSWVGSYDDDYLGQYPATIFWEFNFLTDSTGKMKIFAVIAAQPQEEMTFPFRYSITGTKVSLFGDVFGDEPETFDYDTTLQSFTLVLYVGDGNVWLGGTTIFHLKGEEQSNFPVNTIWRTEQQVPIGDTLMPVTWRLDFWEYGWGGQLSYCGGDHCGGTSHFWQYDTNTHSGIIYRDVTHQYSFTYDPTSDILTLEYSSTLPIGGNNVPVGGTLSFHKDTAEMQVSQRKDKTSVNYYLIRQSPLKKNFVSLHSVRNPKTDTI